MQEETILLLPGWPFVRYATLLAFVFFRIEPYD